MIISLRVGELPESWPAELEPRVRSLGVKGGTKKQRHLEAFKAKTENL